MKACVLLSNNHLEYKEIENPTVKDDEVLVKIITCGICSSDFNRVYKNGAYFYPIVLGHEFSGIIIKCGKNINNKYLNKKVVVFPLLPCGECEFCNKKMYAQCKNYKYFGSRCNGAMAEYISVPFWNIKIIPDNMSCTIAALTEPCAVAIHTINKIKDIQNKKICISGSGTIGILCGLIAKSQGAEVTYILRNNKKSKLLDELGLDYFIQSTEKSFNIAIECVGTNSSINNCIKYVKSKGEIILVGNPTSDINLEKTIYWKILRSELIISGVWNSSYKNQESDDWDSAIDFLFKHSTIAEKIITKKFKLSDGINAFNEIKDSTQIFLKGVFQNEE